MAVDSVPSSASKDATLLAPKSKAAVINDGSAAAPAATSPSSKRASSIAAVSTSKTASSAQPQASLSNMSISEKASSLPDDSPLGQPGNEGAHLGPDSRIHDFLTAVSTPFSLAEKDTAISQGQCTQNEDKRSASRIEEARERAEVPSTAATGTSTTRAPLTAASTPGETQGQAISGNFAGQYPAPSATPSGSGHSPSSASSPGSPASPQAPASPRLAPAVGHGDVAESLQLGITHLPNGVCIQNCPRGHHVAIYAPNFTQVSVQPPASMVSSFGEVVGPGLRFKVMEDGGICGVQLPEGTQTSVRLVPAVRGLEAGIGGGGAAVDRIFVTVDGYSVVFRFSL